MFTDVINKLPTLLASVVEGNAILIADGGLRVSTQLFPIGEFIPVGLKFDKEISLEERASQSQNPLMKASNGGIKSVINGSMYLTVNGNDVNTPLSGSQIMALCLLKRSRDGRNATIGDVFAKSREVDTMRNGQPSKLVVLDIFVEGKEEKMRPFVTVASNGAAPVFRFNGVDTDVSQLGVSVNAMAAPMPAGV
jgi:hypothetical protein